MAASTAAPAVYVCQYKHAHGTILRDRDTNDIGCCGVLLVCVVVVVVVRVGIDVGSGVVFSVVIGLSRTGKDAFHLVLKIDAS